MKSVPTSKSLGRSSERGFASIIGRRSCRLCESSVGFMGSSSRGVACNDESSAVSVRAVERLHEAVSVSGVDGSCASMMATVVNAGWWSSSFITEV